MADKVRLKGDFKKRMERYGKKSGKVNRYVLRTGRKVAKYAKKALGASPRRIDTGTLRASIGVTPTEPVGCDVGSDLDYALFVHNGTSKMEANPFLLRALAQVRSESGG